MKSVYRLLVALLICVALTGCGGGSRSENSNPRAGNYTLVGIEGAALPGVVFEGTIVNSSDPVDTSQLRIVATQGYLRLNADGTYVQQVQHVATVDGATQPRAMWNDRGTYRDTGERLEFDSNFIQNIRFSATSAGEDLRVLTDIVGEGRPVTYVYRR